MGNNLIKIFYVLFAVFFAFVFYIMYSHSLNHDFTQSEIIVKSVITSLGIFSIPIIIHYITSKRETT